MFYLYDSHGVKTEIETDIPYVEMRRNRIPETEDVFLQVLDYIDQKYEDHSMLDIRLREDIFRVDITKMSDITETFGTKKDVVCGISLLINPVDFVISGMKYFKTNKELYDTGFYGAEIPFDKIITVSETDETYFAEIQFLRQEIAKDFHLMDYPIEIYEKNAYIIRKEAGRSNRQFVYQSFKELRALLSKDNGYCGYKNFAGKPSYIRFVPKRGEEEQEDYIFISNTILLYHGYYFLSIKDFYEAYKMGRLLEVPTQTYGEDKEFMQYLRESVPEEE